MKQVQGESLAEYVNKLIAAGFSNPEIRAQIKISARHLRNIRAKYNEEHPDAPKYSTGEKIQEPIKRPLKAAKSADLESDRYKASSAYWENQYRDLRGQYDKLLKEDSVVGRLVSDIRSIAPTSYVPTSSGVFLPKPEDSTSTQSAVLMFSDTHVGKQVYPEQTLNFGEYDLQVFLDRLQFLEDAVIRLLSEHASCNVDELVILMLGDMLDGALGHANEMDQVLTKFGQFYAGGHAIAQFFRNLAAVVPKVKIRTCTGNHTRWGEQRKMPTKNRFSNLDMFLYSFVQALTSDVKNIEWDLNMQPFQYFTVKNSIIFAAHGDHLRGGDKALGIPSHAFGRQLSSMCQMLGKRGDPNPDYYCFGHFHREMQLPHAKGKIFVNGAFPGVDEYALTSGFTCPDPEQKFFLIHPKYQVTGTWPIYLKFAEAQSSRYVIPQEFI